MTTNHYSPLRYPGGKAKLYDFVRDLIIHNGLEGGSYTEPYAGGAGVALALLFDDYVSEIHINDIDERIHAFWDSVLNKSDEFIRKIWDTPVNMDTWQAQKNIQKASSEFSSLELGFSTFFLNRTNRSGVLTAGVIGGNDQKGNYKIDARYNKQELCRRISKIAYHRKHIKLYHKDAVHFLKHSVPKIKQKGLVFLDPPYFTKGQKLYTSFYSKQDHQIIADTVNKSKLKHWIITYDNVSEINTIYDLNRKLIFDLRYSLSHTNPKGSELLIYSRHIRLPRHPNGHPPPVI